MLNPEDNLEGIYRDFAENYPLKPGATGWEELSAKMEKGMPEDAKKPAMPVVGAYALGKKYWYAVAILFLLASFVSIRIITAGPDEVNKDASAPKNIDSVSQPLNNTTTATVNNKPAAVQQKTPPRDTRGQVPSQTLQPGQTNNIYHNAGSHIKNASSGEPLQAISPAEIGKTNSPMMQGQIQRDAENGTVLNSGTAASPKAVQPNNESMKADSGKLASSMNAGGAGTAANEQARPLEKATNAAAPAAESKAPGPPPGKSIAVKNNQQHFYFSLLAGPDVSTVKFQNAGSVGLSVGAMAGFQLSKRISLEAGLLMDKKNYFSSGKYFDKNAAGITDPDDRVKSVNGIGNFIEIPVIARLNLLRKRKNVLFVSAGLSSYITEREHYTLSIQHPAGYETRGSDNDDRQINLFSLLHLSAGYQFILTSRSSLQAEPYIKLPFSGIGHGSLPITSTGIYFKYTYSLLR